MFVHFRMDFMYFCKRRRWAIVVTVMLALMAGVLHFRHFLSKLFFFVCLLLFQFDFFCAFEKIVTTRFLLLFL